MHLLNLLVSTCCLFLLLFSIHLFFAKKGNKLLNILLSIIFFARFGQILNSLLITSGHYKAISVLYQVFTPFYYIVPACFYLYISCFIHNRKKLKKLQWLHFIPGLLAIIHIIPWQNTNQFDWSVITKQLSESGYLSLRAQNGLFPPYFHYILRPLLVSTYLCLAWFEIIRLKTDKEKTLNPQAKNWIGFFIKICTFFQLVGLVPIILRNLHIDFPNSSFIIMNCIALLSILLYALHKPNFFYGYLLIDVDWNKNLEERKSEMDDRSITNETEQIQTEKRKQSSLPIKKVNLTADQLSAYAVSMKELMKNELLYTIHDFQIIDLAAKLNIPIHHCSFIINNQIGKNFRDWINGYRVEHFLKQYPIKGDKITIEAIAYEAGFKSLATFYNAFKKEKGVMPTTYLSTILPIKNSNQE